MKNNFLRSVAVGAIGAFLASICLAQSGNKVVSAVGDKYMISARAGGINYVEGTVTVMRKTGQSGHLIKGDTLEIGDRVSTGADGKAEILLNPGSYARLGANSLFEFKTTDLDDLQLRLGAGSAMLEVFASDDFKVSVFAPKGKFYLVESGVFRIDILNGGSGKISVWDGKAELADSGGTIIKKGQSGTVNGPSASIAKFDRNAKDDLTVWSKTRAKELTTALAGLKNQGVRTSLMRSFLGGRWGVFNSFGLWVYDPFSFTSCFLPFGYGWRSPYGYGYGHNLGWYNLPPVVYTPTPVRVPSNVPDDRKPIRVNPPAGVTGTGGGGAPNQAGITARDRNPVPPFVRMQQDSGRGPTRGAMPDFNPPNTNQMPTYSSPPAEQYSPPPPAPSPVMDGARPRKDG